MENVRLIDANALKNNIEQWFVKNRYYNPHGTSDRIPKSEVFDVIDNTPTAVDLPELKEAYQDGYADGLAKAKTDTPQPRDFTAEELRAAVEKIDVTLQPYAVVCNPIHEEIIKQEFGDRFKILATPVCEEGKGYFIDRKAFNDLTGNIGGTI